MAVMVLALFGVIALALILGAWTAAGRPSPTPTSAGALVVLRAARRRAVISIALASAVTLAGIVSAICAPEWLGLGAAVAPALAGAAGLALYAATPPPQDPSPRARYAATLQPRTPWNIAPRAALAALGIAFSLQLCLLAFTGMTSSTDEQGRFRTISFADGMSSSTAGPYPGWFYALPLMGATLVLGLGTWAALVRIAITASLPGPGLEELDTLWRSRSSRVVVGLSMAMICFQLGGTALFAGITMRNAQYRIDVPAGWPLLAAGLTLLGFVSLLFSLVVLALAARRAFTLPHTVMRVGPPAGSRP